MREDIKKENRKYLKKFIVIIIVSMLCGAIVGVCTQLLSHNMIEIIISGIRNFLAAYGGIVMTVVTIIVCVATGICLQMSYKQLSCLTEQEKKEEMEGSSNEGMAEERELQYEKIERRMDFCMLLTSLDNIICFFLFAVIVITGIGQIITIIWTLTFVIAILVIIYMQQKIADCEKEMNPGLKGSVYDLRFQKKWEESCDEAQKATIYHASYCAMQVTNYTCMGFWLVLVILSFMVENTSILPVTVVSVIWAVQNISYVISSMTFGRKENKNDNKV